MAEQSITINGVETTLTATGFATWTASDISLRLRPDAITWNATRGELSAKGTSAQTATDNLLAAERKAAKAAQLTARSTTGQIFARDVGTPKAQKSLRKAVVDMVLRYVVRPEKLPNL